MFVDMSGYTKLFASIITSTIWSEPKETKILWITMLAAANKDGIVEGSVPGLACIARLSTEETAKALLALESPDVFSRTKTHEGRRIQTIEGGWQLLNHAKYRALMSAEDRREYLRKKQAEHRAKLPVKKRQQTSTVVTPSSTPSTHSEADTRSSLIPSADKPPRERNPLFDALAIACGSDPLQMTKPQATTCGVKLAEIKKVSPNLTITEIQLRVKAYRQKYRDAPCTPSAICAHWGELGSTNGHEPATQSIAEPLMWQSRLRSEFPDSRFIRDGDINKPWLKLSRDSQRTISEVLK